MKKYVPYVFLLFIISNCKEKNKLNVEKENIDDIIRHTTNDTITSISFTPVFLTLSPHMSSNQYNQELSKLNKSNQLEGSKFVIKLNNKDYYFDLSKNPESITLKKSNKVSKKGSDLSYDTSKKLNKIYRDELEPILNLYKNKYKLYKTQIPVDFNLKNYGFEYNRYIL